MFMILPNDLIQRIDDGAVIPNDLNNPDYVEYLDWIASGNEPLQVIIDITVSVVTMRQARLALLQAGLLPTIEAAIDSMGSPAKEAAKIEWEYAQELRIDHPLVVSLTAAIGMTGEQLSDLFTAAAAI
jgi:hypothetical protein